MLSCSSNVYPDFYGVFFIQHINLDDVKISIGFLLSSYGLDECLHKVQEVFVPHWFFFFFFIKGSELILRKLRKGFYVSQIKEKQLSFFLEDCTCSVSNDIIHLIKPLNLDWRMYSDVGMILESFKPCISTSS